MGPDSMNRDRPMDPLPPDVQHWRRRRLAFAPRTTTPSKEGFEAFKRSLCSPFGPEPESVRAWRRKMEANPSRIKQPLFSDRTKDWMSY